MPGVYDVDTRERLPGSFEIQGNQKCVITTEALSLETIEKICQDAFLRGDQMKDAGVTVVEKWENPPTTNIM